MDQCWPWSPGSISGVQHMASCSWQLEGHFYGFELLAFCLAGRQAPLRPETGPCEKHRVREGREESFCPQRAASPKEVVGGLCARVHKILMTQD